MGESPPQSDRVDAAVPRNPDDTYVPTPRLGVGVNPAQNLFSITLNFPSPVPLPRLKLQTRS